MENYVLLDFRQHRIIQVCGLRSKIFRQIGQMISTHTGQPKIQSLGGVLERTPSTSYYAQRFCSLYPPPRRRSQRYHARLLIFKQRFYEGNSYSEVCRCQWQANNCVVSALESQYIINFILWLGTSVFSFSKQKQ